MASDVGRKEQMANILFVSATVPYPATDGGRIRVLNLVRRLCRIHKVTLLTFITSSVDEQGAEYLRKMGVDVVGIRLQQQKLTVALRSLLQSFMRGKPLTVSKYYSAEMVKAMKNLLKLRRFDVIHFEMLHTGQYILDLRFPVADFQDRKSVGTVLGEQNIDSSIWYKLVREESNLLKKLIFYSQYRSFMSYESRICGYFDLCICVSAQDQRTLESVCPGAKTGLVPNGVDPDYFKPGEAEEDETCLIFTGSMDWHPNEDAVLHFCHHILPLIHTELPEVKFYIVGSNPTDRVLRLGRIQGVTVTGLVEDVRPYIASAAVYVVPLRIGGGTRLKILEALAMKKAVVSTSIGCEGLDLQPDKHLLVADNPQQFAAETVQLIKDRSLRRRLGENGKTLVQGRYDWDVVIESLDLTYRRLISKRSGTV